MPNWNQNLDARVQGLRGRAAWGGQAYDVFRLSGSVNNALSASAPVISAFQAKIDHETSKRLIENETFNLLVYEAVCDNRTLAEGDLCQETGYREDGGFYYVAQMRPRTETLWVRAEQAATITRAFPTAGQDDQQPASGNVATSGYGGRSWESDLTLQLVDGVYAFVNAPATPATVQVGVQPRDRLRDNHEPNVAGVGVDPTAISREHFVVYVPLLPASTGYLALQPHDQLQTPTGLFDISLVYTSGLTGLSGNVLVCELVH